MAGILLLISTFLVVAYSASITINCGAVDTVGVVVNCLNYQVLSLFAEPATNALNRYFNDCVGAPGGFDPTVTNTITLSAGTTCIVNQNLLDIPAAFAGTFTLTSSATNPATIQMDGPTNGYLFTQSFAGSATTLPSDSAILFSNLILNADNTGRTRFAYLYSGDITMSNIQIVDSVNNAWSNGPVWGSGFLLTARGALSNGATFPKTYNVSVSDIAISQSTIDPDMSFNGPIIALGSGFDATVSSYCNRSVHEQSRRSLLLRRLRSIPRYPNNSLHLGCYIR